MFVFDVEHGFYGICVEDFVNEHLTCSAVIHIDTGYGFGESERFFDIDDEIRVCSVGIRILSTHRRKQNARLTLICINYRRRGVAFGFNERKTEVVERRTVLERVFDYEILSAFGSDFGANFDAGKSVPFVG